MAVSKAANRYIATLVNKYVATRSATTVTDKPKLSPPPENYTPNVTTYGALYSHRFTLKQLQGYAKALHIKVSDVKKDMLVHHIYMYFVLQQTATAIQALFRGYLQRKLLRLQGFLKGVGMGSCAVSRFSRKCINDTDFVTLEEIGDIPIQYFYGYDTGAGASAPAMYGFNMTSLYNYCGKGGQLMNPYTREPFRTTLRDELAAIVRLSGIVYGRPLDLAIEEPVCTGAQKMELRAVSVFQTLNELGNYSDVNWFLGLTREATVKYIAEFYDIWNHRAGLSRQLKMELCPPDGDLFRDAQTLRHGRRYTNNIHHRMLHEPDLHRMKSSLLDIFARLIQTDYVALDNRKLNAMYILAGLTLVCPAAADAMPIYYFSVAAGA